MSFFFAQLAQVSGVAIDAQTPRKNSNPPPEPAPQTQLGNIEETSIQTLPATSPTETSPPTTSGNTQTRQAISRDEKPSPFGQPLAEHELVSFAPATPLPEPTRSEQQSRSSAEPVRAAAEKKETFIVESEAASPASIQPAESSPANPAPPATLSPSDASSQAAELLQRVMNWIAEDSPREGQPASPAKPIPGSSTPPSPVTRDRSEVAETPGSAASEKPLPVPSVNPVVFPVPSTRETDANEVARWRDEQADLSSEAREQTVLFSIGTLQISVEAPPVPPRPVALAPAAKPVSVPSAPHLRRFGLLPN